jgi:hypothetical protein
MNFRIPLKIEKKLLLFNPNVQSERLFSEIVPVYRRFSFLHWMAHEPKHANYTTMFFCS